jgi:protein tyrosine/serine phosphatase
MRQIRRPVYNVAALLAVFTLSLAAYAQQNNYTPAATTPSVQIKNFGQMDERFYRGAQPKENQYESLKALGIKTVIDLQSEPTEYEKRVVESLGMRYVNIPMVSKKYPKPEHVEQFMKLVDDPETGKFYLHCAGGRHRTGVMGAVYRFNKYGWDFTRVYKEMKDFDFYTAWGHGDFKKFVEDYWQNVQSQRAVQPAVQSQATAAGAQQ